MRRACLLEQTAIRDCVGTSVFIAFSTLGVWPGMSENVLVQCVVKYI